MEYLAFAIGEGLRPWEFYRLTYNELWVYILTAFSRSQRERAKMDDQLWFHGDLIAKIWNCWMVKPDKSPWTYKDFVTLSTEVAKPKEKLTLKKARQSLGSTFKLNEN